MTPVRRLATLLAAVVLVLAGLEPAALAFVRKDYLRHADISCAQTNASCRWRLWMRSGRVLDLKNAIPSPLAVSPHGAELAYFRRSDSVLVVRDITTGKVRAVPGVTRPPGDGVGLRLSPLARFALITVNWGAPRVVDTFTGREQRFPFKPSRISFSPDNTYVLAYFADSSPGYAVIFSTRTWTEVRRGGPVVGALSMDGTKVADVEWAAEGSKVRVRDVTTGAQVGRTVTLRPGQSEAALAWNRAGHLDILLITRMTDEPPKRRMTLEWRRVNDGMRLLDTFTASADHAQLPAGGVIIGP